MIYDKRKSNNKKTYIASLHQSINNLYRTDMKIAIEYIAKEVQCAKNIIPHKNQELANLAQHIEKKFIYNAQITAQKQNICSCGRLNKQQQKQPRAKQEKQKNPQKKILPETQQQTKIQQIIQAWEQCKDNIQLYKNLILSNEFLIRAKILSQSQSIEHLIVKYIFYTSPDSAFIEEETEIIKPLQYLREQIEKTISLIVKIHYKLTQNTEIQKLDTQAKKNIESFSKKILLIQEQSQSLRNNSQNFYNIIFLEKLGAQQHIENIIDFLSGKPYIPHKKNNPNYQIYEQYSKYCNDNDTIENNQIFKYKILTKKNKEPKYFKLFTYNKNKTDEENFIENNYTPFKKHAKTFIDKANNLRIKIKQTTEAATQEKIAQQTIANIEEIVAFLKEFNELRNEQFWPIIQTIKHDLTLIKAILRDTPNNTKVAQKIYKKITKLNCHAANLIGIIILICSLQITDQNSQEFFTAAKIKKLNIKNIKIFESTPQNIFQYVCSKNPNNPIAQQENFFKTIEAPISRWVKTFETITNPPIQKIPPRPQHTTQPKPATQNISEIPATKTQQIKLLQQKTQKQYEIYKQKQKILIQNAIEEKTAKESKITRFFHKIQHAMSAVMKKYILSKNQPITITTIKIIVIMFPPIAFMLIIKEFTNDTGSTEEMQIQPYQQKYNEALKDLDNIIHAAEDKNPKSNHKTPQTKINNSIVEKCQYKTPEQQRHTIA